MCPWQNLRKQTESHKGFTPFLNSFVRIILHGFSALPLETFKFIVAMKNVTVQSWNMFDYCLRPKKIIFESYSKKEGKKSTITFSWRAWGCLFFHAAAGV